jgi:hypothetical protein
VPSAARNSSSPVSNPPIRAEWLLLFGIAAVIALLHILTNGRYGFHRDELQFLSDARHLDWGFVAYPPLTPFLQHIGLALFGVSLTGLRLFSVLFQAAAIIVSGLMAKELGGGRLAQCITALAVALSPLPLFNGTEFQYTSFDFFWWVLTAYFIIRLLSSEDPRWWLAIGATLGCGLLTKYAIVFYIAGILTGIVLTPARRYLTSLWFWAGFAVALLLFLPNFLWLVHHDFISYHFLKSIHLRDVRLGRADGFLLQQFFIGANLAVAPLWMVGVIAYLRCRRYRMVAFMYLVPLALFFFGKGRGYYMAAAYPMLIAMGATRVTQRLALLPAWGRRSALAVYFAAFAVVSAYIVALVIPLQAAGPLRDFALKRNGDLREEIGWQQMVATVASIRNSLPPDRQSNLGILVGNYGEQGAIEILGPPYHLPPPISMTNSAWLRGYPTPPPTTLIVLGFSQKDADLAFTNCRLAGHNANVEGIRNEESQVHPDIFVCGPPRKPWPQFWTDYQAFG